jgi:hypothetical protein
MVLAVSTSRVSEISVKSTSQLQKPVAYILTVCHRQIFLSETVYKLNTLH